jgi:DNA-3-methyladenine glycosylase I
MLDDGRIRCGWAGSDPLNRAYHDQEWGVPLKDDRRLFEMLVLEGFQAGLSWITILRKRDNFRKAFDGFDPEKIAGYDPGKIDALLADPGIVRNRAKVEGAILSARGFKFVGPTICYAFMQATGMVDDHLVDCFRHSRARSQNQ